MALETATPQEIWEIYAPEIEAVRLGYNAAPVLVWEVPTDTDNIFVAHFEIEPGESGVTDSVSEAVAEVLRIGHDPCRVVMSSEVWSQHGDDEPFMEAAGFVYTAREEAEPEWIAEAPFTRTMTGVVWHYDRFSHGKPRDSLTPVVDILRGMVGRFS